MQTIASKVHRSPESDQTENRGEYGESRTFNTWFADVDRYYSDHYDCSISLRTGEDHIWLGFLISAGQLGVASFVRYWIYDKGESATANKTFDELKKVTLDLRNQIEYQKIPPVNIYPIFRRALQGVDLQHMEKSFNPLLNFNVEENRSVSDYRESLYGNRYPSGQYESFKSFLGHDTGKKEVEESGSGRSKILKYISQW